MRPGFSLFLLQFKLLEKQTVSDLAIVMEAAHRIIERSKCTFHREPEINKLAVDM